MRSCSLKPRQIYESAGVMQTVSSSLFLVLSWEVQYITKHFMNGPAGKNEFCFPSTSMLLLASPQETMRVSGKQNSLAVSLGVSHNVVNV